MLAFHNDPAVKEKYLARVREHQKLDEIHKGEYANFRERKFCAVGCTIHSNNHLVYEKELGIPMLLARLEDSIFENLPDIRSKTWPEEFLSAIKPGVNLEGIWPKFAAWLLTDKEYGVIKYAKTEEQKEIIQKISDYYDNYKNINKQEWKDAAASSSADAAYAAYTADAAYAAAYAAKEKIRVAQADKLLELLKNA